MAIQMNHYGPKKPGTGVKPISTKMLPKNPFGFKNHPVDWASGKHLRLSSERAVDDVVHHPFKFVKTGPNSGYFEEGTVRLNGEVREIAELPADWVVKDITEDASFYIVYDLSVDPPTAQWLRTTGDPMTSGHVVPLVDIECVGGVIKSWEQRRWSDIVLESSVGPAGADGEDANPPDSGIDSTDFAESIATRTVGDASASEIAGFFVGAPEAKTLADLLDASEANEKSNYKVLVRKHEAGERPTVGFVPIGDLTDGTSVVGPGGRDPDDEADSCGEGGYPGIDPGDGTDGFPGSGDEADGGYPGDGSGGDGTGGDGGDYPGKGNDCW